MQNETTLETNSIYLLDRGVLLLITQIAATSPTLYTVYINNDLGGYGPAIATTLAASETIHIVDIISFNTLKAFGPDTAAALATSKTIHTIKIHANNISEYSDVKEIIAGITAQNNVVLA